ncbi:MAG: heparinase II/III family protein, partial [Pyrinomonadaceae bacterium]
MADETNSGNSSPRGSNQRSFTNRLRRAFRGEVDARTVALEVVRRSRAAFHQRRERADLDQLNTRPARLHSKYANLYPDHLLAHFRDRTEPKFLRGFVRSFEPTVPAFKIQTATITPTVAKPNEWLRDPVSGIVWPLDYHLDLKLQRGDGSDVRVLWELNRLGHFVELAAAYTATRDEKHAKEFFVQMEDWRKANPVGRGPNWACAMEVALRAMNLLAAFAAFRHSPEMDAARLQVMLAMFEQHGEFIRRNLEFSYIATSNHYLSDVVGLLWLGIMLPELRAAHAWRKFGLREMLHEMEVQILPDGADFESSTGYHRLTLELFMYSFILCRENGIEIESRYWGRLRGMVAYLRAYVRPDGRAPLVGDTDGGQALPVVNRDGDDHAYLAAVGAALFEDPALKINDESAP